MIVGESWWGVCLRGNEGLLHKWRERESTKGAAGRTWTVVSVRLDFDNWYQFHWQEEKEERGVSLAKTPYLKRLNYFVWSSRRGLRYSCDCFLVLVCFTCIAIASEQKEWEAKQNSNINREENAYLSADKLPGLIRRPVLKAEVWRCRLCRLHVFLIYLIIIFSRTIHFFMLRNK